MKIGLVGWGIETKSAYRYFGGEHEYLICNEEPRDDFPSGDRISVQYAKKTRQPGLTGNVDDLSYLDTVDTCDLIVLTPTAAKTLERIHPRGNSIWKKVTTTIQLFFENSPSKNIIGVTGTKGKGTTTTLIGKMLEADGMPVHVGGNIGLPVLDLLPEVHKDDWVVLELSNFQLYHFPYSPHIAVHLMTVPEHIAEWHIEVEDYVNAKANIFKNQGPDDIAIYLETNEHSATNVLHSPAQKKIPFFHTSGASVKDGWIEIDSQKIIATKDVGLTGAHNLENVCAAVTTIWQIHQNIPAMKQVITEFTGMEHRLQHVATVDEAHFYDDSFGTTPDTAIVAMDSFEAHKVMIVGGHPKGNDMKPLVDRLSRDDVRSVIGIGKIGLDIVALLRKQGTQATLHAKEAYNDWTMEEIVELAAKEAQPGDIVLLSAGTSSFGIFKDYKDRGNQFIDAVHQLSS